jgi:hypothetical protein
VTFNPSDHPSFRTSNNLLTAGIKGGLSHWVNNASCLAGDLNYALMYPGKKVGADPIWRCPELCPADLIKLFDLDPALINQDELLRAEWFWNRKPSVLCANLLVLFSYMVIFVCLIYFLPECAAPVVVWLLLGAGGVVFDCVRLDRWEREYQLSIKRLILHLPKRKQ